MPGSPSSLASHPTTSRSPSGKSSTFDQLELASRDHERTTAPSMSMRSARHFSWTLYRV
jgi:hypothetical protein